MNEEQKLKEFFEYVRVMGDMYEEQHSPKDLTVRKTLDEITFVFLENKERIKFAWSVLLDSLIDVLFSIHIFHKWGKIYKPVDDYFIGRKIIGSQVTFRKCTHCGKIQEYLFDSGGGCWTTLNDDKVNIVNEEIRKGNLFLEERE